LPNGCWPPAGFENHFHQRLHRHEVSPEVLARTRARFLQKPYTHADLAKAVRDCLDKNRFDAAWKPTRPGEVTVAILSDIHYAGAAERARGRTTSFAPSPIPCSAPLPRAYRHFVWMRHPLDQGRQLDRFLAEVRPVDYLVANGDYSCDSGFVGVSDPAAFPKRAGMSRQTAREIRRPGVVHLRRSRIGQIDSLFGGKGEMRLASWHCAHGNARPATASGNLPSEITGLQRAAARLDFHFALGQRFFADADADRENRPVRNP
jgi:hypothetical protein